MTVNTEQRIYIGGFDPDRLKASEVLARLRTVPGVHIETPSTSENGDRNGELLDQQSFLHIQARLIVTSSSLSSSLSTNAKDDTSSTTATATATTTKATTVATPLQILQKLYHNVKWKGCKLSVQAAKPHFLERLAEEIQQRKSLQATSSSSSQPLVPDVLTTTKTKTDDAETTTTITAASDDIFDKGNSNSVNPAVTSSGLKRQLILRRRHGDPSVPVDTKPWQVQEWTSFERLIHKRRQQEEKQKLKQQQQQQQQQQQHSNSISSKKDRRQPPITTKSNIRPVRAVHLRFLPAENNDDDDDDDDDVKGHVPKMEEDDDDDEDDSTSTSTSEVSDESEHEKEKATNRKINNHTKSSSTMITTKPPESRYVWSDDDESSSGSGSSSTSSSGNIRHGTTNKNATTKERPAASTETSLRTSRNAAKTNATMTSLEQRSAVIWDEFAAALDDNDNVVHEDDKETDMPRNNKKARHDNMDSSKEALPLLQDGDAAAAAPLQLQDDIESNLKILSFIFPDMHHIKPVSVAMEEDDGHDDDDTNKGDGWQRRQIGSKSGGVSSMLMQRYDPTNPISAQRYEKALPGNKMENDKDTSVAALAPAEVDSSLTRGQQQQETSMDSTEGNNDDHHGKDTKTSGFIYEQDLLEKIFRQARSGGDPMLPPDAMDHVHDIDVDHHPKNDEHPLEHHATSSVTGFSFGFAVAPPSPPPPRPAPKSASVDKGFSFGFAISPPSPTPVPDAKASATPRMPVDLKAPSSTTTMPVTTLASSSAVSKHDVAADANAVETDSPQAKTPATDITNQKTDAAVMDDSGSGDADQPDKARSRREEKTTDPSRRVVVGLWFPSTVLDQYVTDFYGLNDGNHIMADLEGFRRDPAVQEQWNRERHVLTEDWKRKRKYAQSSKQQYYHRNIHGSSVGGSVSSKTQKVTTTK